MLVSKKWYTRPYTHLVCSVALLPPQRIILWSQEVPQNGKQFRNTCPQHSLSGTSHVASLRRPIGWFQNLAIPEKGLQQLWVAIVGNPSTSTCQFVVAGGASDKEIIQKQQSTTQPFERIIARPTTTSLMSPLGWLQNLAIPQKGLQQLSEAMQNSTEETKLQMRIEIGSK